MQGHLIAEFGQIRARDFSTKKLKSVQDAMIEAGLIRGTINKNISRMRQREAVPARFLQPLLTRFQPCRQSAEERVRPRVATGKKMS